MLRPSTVRQFVLWLGYMSSLGVIASVLALTDIFHGESDVSLEWSILRVALLLSIAFHGMSIVALRRT
jgi:hypothetical protein